MKFPRLPLLSIIPILLLAACKEDVPEPEVARPVLSVIASYSSPKESEFTGTVEPRYSTNLGFQVLGRMISRKLDTGDRVKKGELIALIDPKIYEFAVNVAKANLTSAEAQLANATASEARLGTLAKSGVSSPSELDAAQKSKDTAKAAVSNAQAELQKAEEQLGYTRLEASFDGIVVATEAEVGQVVAAGDTIVTVARLDQRDAVIDMPEGLVGRLKDSAFTVSLQAFPAPPVKAKIREIAPQAESVTRTRRIRMTLENPPEVYRLGAIVSARALDRQEKEILLPLSALLEEDGNSFVWLVDEAGKAVRKQAVKVGRKIDSRFSVLSGVEPGMRVVTAGVHSLKQGQKISLGDEKPS